MATGTDRTNRATRSEPPNCETQKAHDALSHAAKHKFSRLSRSDELAQGNGVPALPLLSRHPTPCWASRLGHENPHDGTKPAGSKRGSRDANFAKLRRQGSIVFSGKPAVALAVHSSGLTFKGYMLQVVAMLAPRLLPHLGLSSSPTNYAAPRRDLD